MGADEQIKGDVFAELSFEPRVAPSEVGVSVRHGIVTLRGSVDSLTKRWAAEQATMRVKGVKAVNNELQVVLPSASRRDDSQIAAAALRALDLNTMVRADHLSVFVANAAVTLRGIVQWHYESEEAERVVRNLPGVRGITNLVTVKPRRLPAHLKQEIVRALDRNAEADPRRISVDVRGSKVILRGHVRALVERAEVERIAWMAPGVTQVEDLIMVV